MQVIIGTNSTIFIIIDFSKIEIGYLQSFQNYFHLISRPSNQKNGIEGEKLKDHPLTILEVNYAVFVNLSLLRLTSLDILCLVTNPHV